MAAVLLVPLAVLGYVSLTSTTIPSAPGNLPQEPLERPVKKSAVVPEEPKAKNDLTASIVQGEELPAEDVRNLPEEWRSGGDYTLRVQLTKIALPGVAQDGGPQEVEMITYNGRLVGPTIRVRRGDKLKINVINELPATGAPPVTVDPKQEDEPHELYTTNLHTHGLHVSPSGNSDNVFREIPPGSSFQYTYSIPPDHPSGTFWYHPHKHGSVAYQLANGMAGALIVDGGGSSRKVRDLEDIPEIAQAKERVLVLQQLILRKDKHGVGRVDPNDVYSDPPSPDAYQVTAINGMVMPTYYMQPKEVQRWRIIHAGREEPVELQWSDAKNQLVRNIHFREIATDGLATGTIHAMGSILLFPGYRSDVLVKAPVECGTYYLTTAVEQDGQPSSGLPKIVIKALAKLIVRGTEKDMKLPTAAQLVVCKPFESIDPGECKVKRDIVFDYDEEKKIFHINGLSFSKQTNLDRPFLDSAEEWTISSAPGTSKSANEPHPFHIHVNPFQVVQIENLDTKTVTKVNEWRDTIAVEKGKKLTIRMRFRDFPGKTVLHCHTLDHSDQGMMRALQIVDPKQPSDGSEDLAMKLTDCSSPAPPLKLPTTEKMTWALSALRQRTVVLVFFRGMACVHCTRLLRNLLQEARELADSDFTIVAVSSEPIADLENALKSLKVPPDLGFRLLVDEGRLGFRTFGCYEEGPRHGVVVIDKAGMIRAKYVGDVPFADAPEVCARVRQLLKADR